MGRTGGDGVLTAEIPAGDYTLAVAKSGKRFQTPLRVAERQVAEVKVKLDLLFAAGNFGVGFTEVALVAAAAAALGALYAIAARRRSRTEERRAPAAPEKAG
jgi:hypothetical protein